MRARLMYLQESIWPDHDALVKWGVLKTGDCPRPPLLPIA
jgi:hypothetical protein